MTRPVIRPRTGFAFLDDGRDHPGSVLAFAHRGGAGHPDLVGLENTLAAFRHAVGLGYRYLETDVHVTRDGVLVAFHDDVLDRVTDGAGRLADLPAAEVARARVAGREPIPTFEGLLEELPEARFNVDLKVEAAVEPFARLIARTGSQDRVCVGSFRERVIGRFRRLAGPGVATACSPVVVAVRRYGLISWRKGAVLQVPHRYRALGREFVLVTAAFVRRAHSHGLPVHVWTVDDPYEMHELLGLGVDGLFTDRTDLLRDVLRERGQWRDAGR